MLNSVRDEMLDTVAEYLRTDEPLDTLFTANETVRDRNAEFVYRRWLINDGHTARLNDLESWRPHRAVRPEAISGQHAGLLTTPQLIYSSGTVRNRLSVYFDILWCAGYQSQGADAHTLLALDETDLGYSGWQKIATLPLCTGCHARMDYGVQFFDGFPQMRLAGNVILRPHPGVLMPLYGNNINDERGVGPQTPHGFAELALSQPEFPACIVRHVTDHVFAGEPQPFVTHELLAEFSKRHSLRQLMRLALIRYADLARPPLAAPHMTDEPLPPAQPGGDITLPAGLRAGIDRHCGRCHSSGRYDFRGASLTRVSLWHMLFAVAGHSMPRTVEGLSAADRRALTRSMTALLWPAGGGREQALTFVSGDWRPLPGPSLQSRAVLMAGRTQATEGAPVTVTLDGEEKVDIIRRAPLTPANVAAAGLQALRDCRGKSAAVRPDCFRSALVPTDLVNLPP
jgi:hypothetical protein